MTVTTVPRTLSANEAACVTGVPLRQVHRIIEKYTLVWVSWPPNPMCPLVPPYALI